MLKTLAGSSVAIISSLWLNVQVLGFTLQLCHSLAVWPWAWDFCLCPSLSICNVGHMRVENSKAGKRAWVKGWKKLGIFITIISSKVRQVRWNIVFSVCCGCWSWGSRSGSEQVRRWGDPAPAPPWPVSWVLFLHPHSSSERSERLSTSDREGAETRVPHGLTWLLWTDIRAWPWDQFWESYVSIVADWGPEGVTRWDSKCKWEWGLPGQSCG